jgi:hypothetical protein
MRSRLAADDSGAVLVLVLIIVTVLSLALLAVLSLSDTSIRATVALRAQASETYAADAAAKIAVDHVLRTGNCDTLPLNGFYPVAGTAPGASATVRCTPDPNNSGAAGGPNSSPGNALLTLGTEDDAGISINGNDNRSVKVNGGVFSNSAIALHGKKSDLENVNARSYVYAMGSCDLGQSRIISDPAAVCDYGTQPQAANDRRGWDPAKVLDHGASFDPPPAPTVTRTPPACGGAQVYELQPGLYTDAEELNALTDDPACANSVVHLNPGRYYLNFRGPGAHKWTVSSGFLVAGTATEPLEVNKPPAIPGSCVAPGTPPARTSTGVQLVFGGDSRLESAKDAGIELCASNSSSGPPMAIYGLDENIGSGATQVPAQSGCLVATPYPAAGCAVLRSAKSPNSTLVIQGTVYAPRSAVDVALNDNTVRVFRWGLISRGFWLDSTGSTASLNDPLIDIPADAPPPYSLPNLMYLDVYVCPGAGSCAASGSVRLRVKVMLTPDPRSVTVLSWSRPG